MTTTTLRNQNTKTGSIAVYQRIMPNRRPTKVEIIRSIYESCQGPDGKIFGRSNNTLLLRIPSGTAVLSDVHRTKLLDDGLDGKEIDYVNLRLATLAGPARESALSMDLLDASASLKSVVELSNAEPVLAKALCSMLADSLAEVRAGVVVNDGPAELERKAVPEILKDALAVFNKACADAQALYKRLPKGELSDDVVLEFQKSWFSHQDMLNTLRNRKCFSRPARWPALRTQVLDGCIYRYGDPVSDGRLASDLDTKASP